MPLFIWETCRRWGSVWRGLRSAASLRGEQGVVHTFTLANGIKFSQLCHRKDCRGFFPPLLILSWKKQAKQGSYLFLEENGQAGSKLSLSFLREVHLARANRSPLMELNHFRQDLHRNHVIESRRRGRVVHLRDRRCNFMRDGRICLITLS